MPFLLVPSPSHSVPAFLLSLSRAELIPCDKRVWDCWDLVSSMLCRISHWAMPFLTRGPLSGVSGAPPLQAAHTTLTCVLFQLHTLLFACVVWKAAGRSAHRCLCTGLEKAQEIWVCLRVINHISLCFPQRTTALIPTA